MFLAMGIPAFAFDPIPYAPEPNDTYFRHRFGNNSYLEGWHLEGLDTNAVRYAIDINARSAWSLSKGEGVTIAIVDDGVELHHPELTNQAVPSLHWNFEGDIPFGDHPTNYLMHGTAVAGVAVAEGNNNRGVIGVAPEAKFASWVIIKTNATFVNNVQLAKMFDFNIQDVDIQNHSWVKPGKRLIPMSFEEDAAISNAVNNGRSGKGVVIVRAAGNDRFGANEGRNVNDDAYVLDPRAIAVGAIRGEGRVASYSTPGAPILVAAPGGETYMTIMTTDRVGPLGYNVVSFDNDLADYGFNVNGFSGTSVVAPIVSGITALMLSANPNLTVRDVQHILVQAAFQSDPTDPFLHLNAGGFWVTDNIGFGVVNGGTAVQLAQQWETLPDIVIATNRVEQTNAVPDAGLRLIVSGTGVPAELQSIQALPGIGIHADDPSAPLQLVYVGMATNTLTTNLTGKAALIQRGGMPFEAKIRNAAAAGAEFVVLYNTEDTFTFKAMGGTDFAPVPAVMISKAAGEALVALATNSSINAYIDIESVDYQFSISQPMITEHVLLHLDTFHEFRGDLRVTLLSPTGTRSVMKRLGNDDRQIDGTWTYMSTHHFYESPVGTWKLEVSDESDQFVGVARNATLEVRGIPITDTDRDALDDDWERAHFTSLARGPMDDPDRDGYINSREQIQSTNPSVNESPLKVDLSKWNDSLIRLNWTATLDKQYEVMGAANLTDNFQVLATVPGGFPRAAWFGPADQSYRFFTVREKRP